MEQRDPAQDEFLVVRCQRGDAAAFGLLVERWQGRLVSTAQRLTGDEHAALDAVQETWTTIINRLRGLDAPDAFPTWALRILRNKCMDLHRRSARRRRAVEGMVRKARSPQREGNRPSLDDALAALPVRQRVAVVLYYWDGLSVPDIAEIEQVPAGTVKSRLYNAREALRRILKEDEDGQQRR
jgi:RNA polymerase sigma-70 factor (ECF subfamily)